MQEIKDMDDDIYKLKPLMQALIETIEAVIQEDAKKGWEKQFRNPLQSRGNFPSIERG